jgi:TRAP-type mannitol/chloroaromatic compound transport system substrate-binding protein
MDERGVMERRAFLNTAGRAAAAAALATVSYPGRSTRAQARFRWRLAHSFGQRAPILSTHLPRMADALREMSKGQLDLSIYGVGELVPALGLFDAVKEGSIQMMYSASYYWAGKLPAAQFTCSVPFGMTAQQANAWFHFGGGLEVWNEVYARQGLIAFVAGNTGMELGGWFRREMRGVEDLRGLKMRITGLGGRVMEQVGATAVLLPGPEIEQALQRGVIDACEWVGPYYDLQMGLHRAAPYCYTPGWHQPATANELTINLAAWKTLPRELQLMVEYTAHHLNTVTLAEFEARNAEALRQIAAAGRVAFRTFPPDVLKALHAAAERVTQQVAESDADARRVYESYRAFRDRAREWQRLGEAAYHKALEAVGTVRS